MVMPKNNDQSAVFDTLSLNQAIRRVALPGGQTLVSRPVSAEDVDGLIELYGESTLDELHHRFFAKSRPNRASLERVVTVGERGG